MYQLLLLAFLINSLSADKIKPPPEVIKYWSELKQCYTDVESYIKTANETNKTCKNADDFNKKILEHEAIEEQCMKRKLPVNKPFISIVTFLFSHPYAKDTPSVFGNLYKGKTCEYYENLSRKPKCDPLSSCNLRNTRSVIDTKSTTVKSNTTKPEKLNLVAKIFGQKDKYSVRACDVINSTIRCIQRKVFSDCDHRTLTVYLDLQKHMLEECENYLKFSRPKSRIDQPFDMSPRTFWVIVVASSMVVIIIGGVTILTIKKQCQRSEDCKNADKLPEKKNIA